LSKENVELIVRHLRHIRFQGIKKAFGADSHLAVFENVGMEENTEGDGKEYEVCLNLLLNWAGVSEEAGRMMGET
jgi:hypothetical protein